MDMLYRSQGLLRGEVPIQKKELEVLRRKALDHDHYLHVIERLSVASEAMREEVTKGSQYAEGWMACLKLFHMTVLEGGPIEST